MQEKHYLAPLFDPASLAVIGDAENTQAQQILSRLMDDGFSGEIHVCGDFKVPLLADCRYHTTLETLPHGVDVAIITLPPDRALELIQRCGEKGVRVLVLSAGYAGREVIDTRPGARIMVIARQFGMRVLGPNALGIIRPARRLDLSTAHVSTRPGSIALVSQSSSLCRAILDWAQPNHIGFSAVLSVGARIDIDFGDVLDFLISDGRTRSIILHVERISDARRFMSALRGVARVKPVMLLKAGRHPAVARLVAADKQLPGEDRVFNAAVNRCGVIRLYSLNQLFAAANALFAQLHPRGNRLAIVTNGGGLGLMAADRVVDLHLSLAEPGAETVAQMQAALRTTLRQVNPLDLGGKATADDYVAVIRRLADDAAVDGIMVMLSPQSTDQPDTVAQAVQTLSREIRKPMLACWMGEAHVQHARQQLRAAGIPTFRTPEPAVELFSHVHAYYRNQQLLVQVPGSIVEASSPRLDTARMIVEEALSNSRNELGELETKSCLAAFRVPVTRTVIARSATEAVMLAEQIGFPVALKLDSATLHRRRTVPRAHLDLNSGAAVRQAYLALCGARHEGHMKTAEEAVLVEPMVQRTGARELSIKVRTDSVFGPFITLGESGAPISSEGVALPPLNDFLAQDMLRSARLHALSDDAEDATPSINEPAVKQLLLRISEMVCELPWMHALTIDPLIVTASGATVLDARLQVRPVEADTERYAHMAIHPYPAHLVEQSTLPDGMEITIRPIRPEDAELENAFVRRLSPESRYLRFMNTIRELSPAMVVRLTQIDYDREMAFVATTQEDGREIELGVCRYATSADGHTCEFAVVVADAWQGRGIARRLMNLLIITARKRGLKTMHGVFLARNQAMLRFARSLGFELAHDEEDPTIRIGTLALQP